MDNETPFQLSANWFVLGVVTNERLAAMRAEWALGEDQNPEHYRWRAFTAFLAEHQPLEPGVAVALYALGEQDADRTMGEAMMHRVIDLPECPEVLVAAAANSGIAHLAKAAARRRTDAR